MSGELVVVCCHAICTNTLSPHQESNWALKSFQRSDPLTGKIGEHETFLLHIQAGANAIRGRNSVLVFSGARTDPDVPVSEAESYHQVFMQHYSNAEIISQAIADGRVVLEDAATDSYQNLLFSLIKYYELKSEWPRMITIITHSFKESRFLECHAKAIRWPGDRVRIQGINPPFPLAELREVQKLERVTVESFEKDPHGANVPLSTKRAARQWGSGVDVTSRISDDSVRNSLQKLLAWRNDTIFPQSLPWDI